MKLGAQYKQKLYDSCFRYIYLFSFFFYLNTVGTRYTVYRLFITILLFYYIGTTYLLIYIIKSTTLSYITHLHNTLYQLIIKNNLIDRILHVI